MRIDMKTQNVDVGDARAASGKAGARNERAARPDGAPPPSFAAYVADVHFAGDFSIALAAPLVMLGSIARSLDPRVGGGQADTGPGAGPTCGGPPPWEARDDFPVGSNAAVQVLHVARHLVWYTLVRPARHGDWAGLLLNAINLVYPCTLLLVAVSPRTGRVLAWWRRHRLTFLSTITLLGRCALACTFLLLPPAAWPTHTWAGYVVSASRRPLANALALSVYDQFAKVLLLGAVIHAVVETAAVFVLAYLVAPTIVTVQQQPDASPGSGADPASTAPVRLQCGLRPEHSALLPCRPLALQVLLGLAMVAWPVWLSWAVERRLRRRYAQLCQDWGRSQPYGREQQQQAPVEQHAASGTQQGALRSISFSAAEPLSLLCRRSWFGHAVRPDGAYVGPGREPIGPLSAPVPAGGGSAGPSSSRPEGPHGVAGAAAPSVRYRSSGTSFMVSSKVQQHPGSFAEYGSYLASVLYDLVREQFVAATVATEAEPAGSAPSAPGGLGNPAEGTMRLRAAKAAAPASATAAGPNLRTLVIRGCVQVVMWGWLPQGAAGGGADRDAVAAQHLLQRLAGRLDGPGLEESGSGGVRGVSAQVGQAVVVARGAIERGRLQSEGEEQEEEVQAGQAPAASAHWPSGSRAARLLKMDPPAAFLPAAGAAASGPLAVRLLLHSPAPQPARVLVLAERQEAGGAVPPRAVLLREVAVALEGGVQEVEVELGAGELAGAGEGGGRPGGVGVLRVMLVGPVHVGQGGAIGQQEGPRPPPLVHWVAPPLLLLPEGAAGELCGLWEQMKMEQEEEQGQVQPSQATPDGSLDQAASPTGLAAALTSLEQESSLWWSHMAPLMGDLAYALTDGAGRGTGRGQVLPHLLTFLSESGMQHTAAMLQQRNLPVPMLLYDNAYGSGAAYRPPSPERAGSPQLTATTSSSSPAVNAPAARPRAILIQLMSAVGGLIRWLPRLLSIASFSPPALELSYKAWWYAGLAAAAKYMLMVTAQPLLLGLAKTAAQHGMRQALATAPVAVLDWVSESASSLVLFWYFAVLTGGSRGSTTGSQLASESSVITVVRRYTLAGVVLGPCVAVATPLAVALGLLPHFDSFVGRDRALLFACLHQSLILPSVQRLPVRHVLAASPLLAAGEALQLAALQPAWGWRRVVCYVAAWRLVAAAVSAAWEVRARRRFAALVVRRRQHDAGEGGLASSEDSRGSGGGCSSEVKLV